MTTQIRNIIGPFFHAFACIHHIYAILYAGRDKNLGQVTDQRILDMDYFAPVFFTSWNMVIQTVYFSLAMLYDILHILSINQTFRRKIKYYKGYIFTSLVFPASLFVFTMFWGVYSINREWVLPEVLDKYVPAWLNHFLHTNIIVFLVIEVLIVNQLLPTFKSAFIGLSILSAAYHSLFLIFYFIFGRWAYGVFHIFSWPERILFMFFDYLFMVAVIKLGIKIQNFKHNLSRKTSLVSTKRNED